MHNVRVARLPILLLALLFSTCTVHAESTSAKADGKKEAATKETAAKKETAKKEAGKKKRTAKKELLSRQAKIKFGKAEQIALKKVPGKTHEIELELEDGKLVYSVEIEGTDGITEVSIDAISGDVIKVEKDDDDDKKAEGEKGTKGGDEAAD